MGTRQAEDLAFFEALSLADNVAELVADTSLPKVSRSPVVFLINSMLLRQRHLLPPLVATSRISSSG